MPNRAHAATPRRWNGRVLARLAVLLAIGALFVLVTAQVWSTGNRNLATVNAERNGTAYLQPLVQLVGELSNAQSIAVRGGQPDANRMDAAVTTVNTADDTYGDALGTHQRWSELRGRIVTAAGQHVTGAQAYAVYGGVTALAVGLARKIGDVSGLTIDAQLDSYYLTDTVLVRIPDVMVSAGRAADLATLAGAQQPPDAAAPTRISVARYQVAVAAEAAAVSLRKAMDSATTRRTGHNLAGQLDAFQSAVDTFVPPPAMLQTLGQVDPATLAAGSDRVRQQARLVADATLGELDSVLGDRYDRLSHDRTWASAAPATGVLLAIVVLWLLLPAAPRPAQGEADTDEPGVQPTTSRGAGTRLVDPTDLVAVESLLHVGNPIGTQRRERVDDVR
jgi:hypothetical protein